MPDPRTGLGDVVRVDIDDVADPTGATPAPNWRTLPNQIGGTLTLDREEIPGNSKSQAGWRTSATVARGWSIDVSGQADDDNTGFLFIVDTKALGATTDVTVNVAILTANGDTFIGKATLGSIEYSFDDGAFVEYSFTLTGRGPLTPTRA